MPHRPTPLPEPGAPAQPCALPGVPDSPCTTPAPRAPRAPRARQRRWSPPCPTCGTPGHPSGQFVTANGKRQRYRCKPCGVSFSTLTGAPRSRSRLSVERWNLIRDHLRAGTSVRFTAKVAGVNRKTVQRIKAKLLAGVPKATPGMLFSDEVLR